MYTLSKLELFNTHFSVTLITCFMKITIKGFMTVYINICCLACVDYIYLLRYGVQWIQICLFLHNVFYRWWRCSCNIIFKFYFYENFFIKWIRIQLLRENRQKQREKMEDKKQNVGQNRGKYKETVFFNYKSSYKNIHLL